MRMFPCRTAGLFSVLASLCIATAGRAADPESEPLFSRHIVPLFSRLGCNAGNCHGAVQGQNGFRLSLFGVDPAQDQKTLVGEYGGRRLNRFKPDESLLLLKAIGAVPHQGGKRMGTESREYRMLRNWIAAGAPLDALDRSRVKQLKVSPERQTLRPGEGGQLKIEASFADGSTEDVTTLCTYEVVDRDVVGVDVQGRIRATAAGDTALVIRYGAEPVVAMVVVPRPGSEPFPAVKANNFIDEHVLAKLKLLNIPPADLCDDGTFLRRACLDITGALPAPAEVRKFLEDRDPQKRSKKIEELLQRPGHSALWATKFCDLMKVSGFNANFAMVEAAENRRFYEWVRARLKENTPYDQFVERILTATSRENRTQEEWLEEVLALTEENARQTDDLSLYNRRKTLDLYWQREGATGIKGTLQVAHAFLGLRLECAQCHRHPHDVWKQDDLLSFANFFMRTKGAAYPDSKSLPAKYAQMMKTGPAEGKKLSDEAKKLTDRLKDRKLAPDEAEKLKREAQALQMKAKAMTDGPKRFGTEVQFQGGRSSFASVSSPLGTQKSESFRLLGQEATTVAKDRDPRELVMAWLRRPDNPFFARAIVNRVWAHYLGRGLVDPPDHLSPLNPASHPELLTALAEGFVKNNYDLRWLHRTILNSRTYQLSCEATPANKMDKKNYAYFQLRRLPAEVLVDAVNDATGTRETFPPRLYLPNGARALEVAGITRVENETASLSFAFQIFGRPRRDPQIQCDCERDTSTTIVQMLYLSNHPWVRGKIESEEGRIAQLLKEVPDEARRIEELYLGALSRLPTADEMKICRKYLSESPTPRRGLEDILWSLIYKREFILNH